MNEKRLKVLKSLSEEPTDLKRLVRETSLSLGETLEILRSLIKRGFAKKSDKEYLIAVKGKIALKVIGPVLPERGFRFYMEIDQYTGVLAESWGDFLEKIATIDIKSLEFHASRSDFESWIMGVFGDEELAGEFGNIRESGLTGENLRNRILQAVDARYSEFRWLAA